MSENLASAKCTEQEFCLAREAGLAVFTTADERAIHKFANAVRAEEPVALQSIRRQINEKLERAYLLAGRHELAEYDTLRTESEALFAEVREQLATVRKAVKAIVDPA